MQTRYLRLICRSNRVDYPMYLDAAVETTEQGSAIIAKGVLCGFMGDVNGTIHPFLLRKDKSNPGTSLPYLVDFGSDFEQPVRYYNTNLPSKNIGKATQFTVRWFDDGLREFVEHIYEIRDIFDLLRQQPVECL